MGRKTNAVVIATLLALAIAVGTWLKMHYVREDNTGCLLWNTNEANLFMNVHRCGYHFRYLEYPLVVFKEYFNAPPFPKDQSVSVVVLRVTRSGVERHEVRIAGESADALISIRLRETTFMQIAKAFSAGGLAPALSSQPKSSEAD